MTGGRIWAKRAARASWGFPRSQSSKSSGTEAGAPRYRVGARTGLPSHPWGSWVLGLGLWHSKMGFGGDAEAAVCSKRMDRFLPGLLEDQRATGFKGKDDEGPGLGYGPAERARAHTRSRYVRTAVGTATRRRNQACGIPYARGGYIRSGSG
jgi:hypothetical protein